MKKNVFVDWVQFCLIVIPIFAMSSPGTAQNVARFQDYLATKSSDAVAFQALVQELQTSVYFTDGELKQNGIGVPVTTVVKTSDLEQLYADNSLFNSVELLILKISDSSELSASLSLQRLSAFHSLKYVYVIFSFNICGNSSDTCCEAEVKRLITDSDESGKQLIYRLSIPE